MGFKQHSPALTAGVGRCQGSGPLTAAPHALASPVNT